MPAGSVPVPVDTSVAELVSAVGDHKSGQLALASPRSEKPWILDPFQLWARARNKFLRRLGIFNRGFLGMSHLQWSPVHVFMGNGSLSRILQKLESHRISLQMVKGFGFGSSWTTLWFRNWTAPNSYCSSLECGRRIRVSRPEAIPPDLQMILLYIR